jgi:hypothetical protein
MLPVHCYCCLLWLQLWLRLKLRLWLRLKLWLMLHSAQKQGKRGEGYTCSNSHSLLSTLTLYGCLWRGMWGVLFLEPRKRPTGLFPASPLAFASSSCSSLSYLSLCSFSRSLCWTASKFNWGPRLQEPGQGVHMAQLQLIRFSPSKPLEIINLSLRVQFGEACKN